MEKRAWFYFWLLNHNLFFFILRFALFEWIVIINDHGGWVGTLGKSVTSDSRNLSSCIPFLYRPLCPAFKPQTLHFLPTAFSLRNSQPLFRLNYRPRWRSDDSPIKCLLISSSSVWWLSIARPHASTQVWRRKYLRRCEQKRLLCPTEGTFESFPVLECPEESWGGCRGEKRVQDDGGWGRLVVFTLYQAFNWLNCIRRFGPSTVLYHRPRLEALWSWEKHAEWARSAERREKRDQTMKCCSVTIAVQCLCSEHDSTVRDNSIDWVAWKCHIIANYREIATDFSTGDFEENKLLLL